MILLLTALCAVLASVTLFLGWIVVDERRAARADRAAWDVERGRLTAAALIPSNPVGAREFRPKREVDPDAAPRVTPIGL